MSFIEQIEDMNHRIKIMEERFYELGYDMKALVQSQIKKKWRIPAQAETQFGLYTALCIDTIDPWKQNRVRFFNPLFHNPQTPVKSLPWANAISSMGGFDDCGLNWVPPAGSTLCIIFEYGSRQTPFYIGTTWHRDRGAANRSILNPGAFRGNRNFEYNVDEFYQIHEGKRIGYLVGPNDGSQVFPQWNTENYNGFDISSIADFEEDTEAQEKITYPNIYGFKTPQKHMLKLVDGNYKCGHRDKRVELLSACGNYMVFKDDHIHEPSWGHPSCGGGGSDVSDCEDEDTSCGGNVVKKGSNPYFKHQNECRPLQGPGTPQNNTLQLPQSGIQFMSISGHIFVMDDSVEEPSGQIDWQRSIRPFDFGCTDKFEGKTFWVSTTGHRIEMNDFEEKQGGQPLRGTDNYIKLLTATGNRIELNDHTISPNVAGRQRGITMQSTSNHTIEMIDEENEQQSPQRREGGVPVPKATKAFVKIRTGYGLEILMKDENSQEDTVQQHIQIFCPQKDNEERGPHIMRFQEAPSGPGMVFLRVGGDYICMTYDNHFTIVGDEEKNPSDKMTFVTDNTLHYTENFYINIADIHAFIAEEVILLMAGKDCEPEGASAGDDCIACVGPVLILQERGEDGESVVVASDRVFGSASKEAPCVSMFQLLPFTEPLCEPMPQCEGGTV